MKTYRTWNDPCLGCEDRVLPTKEHPYTCHATCQKYKDAKKAYEASKKGIRKQKEANQNADDFTIDCIRRFNK